MIWLRDKTLCLELKEESHVFVSMALRAIEISLVVPSTEIESLGNTKQMGSD